MAHPDGVRCRSLWVVCSKRWRPCSLTCSRDCDFGLLWLFLLLGVRKVKIFSMQWKILLTISVFFTPKGPQNKKLSQNIAVEHVMRMSSEKLYSVLEGWITLHNRTYRDEFVKSLGWKVGSCHERSLAAGLFFGLLTLFKHTYLSSYPGEGDFVRGSSCEPWAPPLGATVGTLTRVLCAFPYT